MGNDKLTGKQKMKIDDIKKFVKSGMITEENGVKAIQEVKTSTGRSVAMVTVTMQTEIIDKKTGKKSSVTIPVAVPECMDNAHAYYVVNGEMKSLPLKKTRDNGDVAELVPYYRTVLA